jgi:hypothetical protein
VTKNEILLKVQRGELRLDEAAKLLNNNNTCNTPVQEKKRERKPPHFRVAIKSGWCSVYFDGLRRPCTLPASLWEELLEADNIQRFRAFLEHNKEHFRNKK